MSDSQVLLRFYVIADTAQASALIVDGEALLDANLIDELIEAFPEEVQQLLVQLRDNNQTAHLDGIRMRFNGSYRGFTFQLQTQSDLEPLKPFVVFVEDALTDDRVVELTVDLIEGRVFKTPVQPVLGATQEHEVLRTDTACSLYLEQTAEAFDREFHT